MMQLEISAASNVGLHREHNEDMALIGRKLLRDGISECSMQMGEYDRFVFAVADGIGGANAGETASMETLIDLRSCIYDLPMFMDFRNIKKHMKKWLKQLNHRIELMGCADISLHGMGTTLSSIILYEDMALIVNCGDSRTYRLRSGLLTQMTEDHSLDKITKRKEDSHVLINSIGISSDSYLDFFDMSGCLFDGDQFLICSDGLTDMVEDDELERLINEGCDANQLIDEALKNGGRDNVTACLIKIHLD